MSNRPVPTRHVESGLPGLDVPLKYSISRARGLELRPPLRDPRSARSAAVGHPRLGAPADVGIPRPSLHRDSASRTCSRVIFAVLAHVAHVGPCPTPGRDSRAVQRAEPSRATPRLPPGTASPSFIGEGRRRPVRRVHAYHLEVDPADPVRRDEDVIEVRLSVERTFDEVKRFQFWSGDAFLKRRNCRPMSSWSQHHEPIIVERHSRSTHAFGSSKLAAVARQAFVEFAALRVRRPARGSRAASVRGGATQRHEEPGVFVEHWLGVAHRRRSGRRRPPG